MVSAQLSKIPGHIADTRLIKVTLFELLDTVNDSIAFDVPGANSVHYGTMGR